VSVGIVLMKILSLNIVLLLLHHQLQEMTFYDIFICDDVKFVTK
jgi:hypothetical protein